MSHQRTSIWIAAAIALIACGFGAGFAFSRLSAPPPAAKPQQKPLSMPAPQQYDQEVELGRRIFTDTVHAAPDFVGDDLKCSNCHLDEGRKANAAPLWAAWGLYPQYRAKNGHVNTFAERIQECFKYSMNGKPPPAGGREVVALETYAAFLAKGEPAGEHVAGQGYLKLPKPAQAPDYARGQAVFQANCVACHGADGAGQRSGDQVLFPPLWGPRSFNWGAGMADINNAAGFIKANMPLGQGGKLSVQEAWDVAAYVDSHTRPQDPRFTGSVAETRKKFHDNPQSMYGLAVGGAVLGAAVR